MATLRYSQVRSHSERVLKYISNKDKMLSATNSNIYNVLSYMGEPESAERVYSFARHCSANPLVAAAQMEVYRTRYYESKNGGVQGLKDTSSELIGLHFFMSYTEGDNPSELTMNTIMSALAEHPLLKDFPVFGANHFDKSHKHTHFYVGQYSATGRAKKLGMRREDFNDLRKAANRLCVQYGLSIIDLPALRHNDPEYSAWIDGVIAAGKITVHPESEEHRGARHQKTSTQKIYFKWLKDSEEFNKCEEKRLTAAQLSAKKARQIYFWSMDGNPDRRPYYVSNDPKKRYYAVGRYNEHGRKRSLVELICMLIIVIYRNEMARRAPPSGITGQVIRARVDRNVQAMMDSVRLAREMNVNTPEDVVERLADTGKQMNGLKQERARLEACVNHQAPVIVAWEQYQQIRANVEGVPDPDPDVLKDYKAAYAILVSNQVLTNEAFEELRYRHQFHRKKISDYQKHLSALKRQYRGLKKLQALISNADRIAEQSYLYQPKGTLDALIQEAQDNRTYKDSQKNQNHKDQTLIKE
ncbi:MAG: relaxase/mobilization nuclease domain-containing protein [Oscillospiraceae bacterium]|nr:relaxase/mobilization nuclease domain-containing protein [Oscillospiraceae bacterium]